MSKIIKKPLIYKPIFKTKSNCYNKLLSCEYLMMSFRVSKTTGFEPLLFKVDNFISLDADSDLHFEFCPLGEYLASGGENIVLIVPEIKQSWPLLTKAVYELLTQIDSHKCHILLVDSVPNLFSGLLSGALLAYQNESLSFKFSRLTMASSTTENWQDVIATCFQDGGRQYIIENNDLMQQFWQIHSVENELPNINKRNQTIILTGGSGAVGKIMAKHLSNQGYLVFLLGRRQLSSLERDELKQSGAKAYLQVDCTNYDDMEEVVQFIEAKFGHINHVFHLAGVTNDGLFFNKEFDSFINTVRPKVSGAEVIHLLSQKFSFDSVVLFSSLSGVIGNVGQTDYSAANACLNEMSLCYHNDKTTWLSINWGLWETESGMQTLSEDSHQAMETESALKALDFIWANELNGYAVHAEGDMLLAELSFPRQEPLADKHDTFDEKQLTQAVNKIIVDCTKIKNLSDEESLLDKGVDSIIATHIAIHIEKALSAANLPCAIPRTLVFQYASVQEIVSYLIDNHLELVTTLYTKISEHSFSNVSQPSLDEKKYVVEQTETEGFAIIAASGEFPGANDLEAFWQLLESGKNAITPIPANRWDWQEDFDFGNGSKGKSYCRHGGFIEKADKFAESHFKITPRDALKLTPEARRMLHQSYYALQHCDNLKSAHKKVAVFVSNMYGHYQNLDKNEELFDSSLSAIANHVSFAFDFKGPSLGVDSMCSGGLSSLNLALNSLTLNECDAALVGAVNIMSHPGKYRFLSEGKFLSQSGRCKSFGVGADGYVPGEGCVVLVVKRLSDALAQNDKILGVVRGCALNATGKHSAITVPSSAAQSDVIKQAIAKSNISESMVSYVETHGTGTSLGDPIEIQGLKQAYGDNEHVAIGALKSNIGHLEGAAGLASIVKVLLQMHHRQIVPTLHSEIENPLLGLDQTPFKLQKELGPWGLADETLYAGVSAFGAGGTNAHVILQSPPKSNAFKAIPSPLNRLKSNSYWASVSNRTSEQVIADDINLDNIVCLTLEQSQMSAPLVASNNLDVQVLWVVSEAQKQTVEDTSHQAFFTEQEVAEFLSQRNEKPATIVHASSLDAHQTKEDYLKSQFLLSKSLVESSQPIHFIMMIPTKLNGLSQVYQASFNGLYRTLALEQSNLKTAIVKTDINLQDALHIFENSVLSGDGYGNTFVYKNANWYHEKPVMDEGLLQQNKTSCLRRQGIYIVTGGLGAVGSILTQHLLEKWQAQVICLGRSNLSGERQATFNHLKSISENVHYESVDITDLNALKDAFIRIKEQFGDINGIINSACLLRDGLFREKQLDDFDAVLASKIKGIINLDELSKDLPLDFFVSLSSLSSIYENVGQTDYCVANTFADYFSHYRNGLVTQGLRHGDSFAHNWPLWDVEGLTLTQQTIDYLCEVTGMVPMPDKKGALAFEYLLAKDMPTQVIPLCGDKDDIANRLLSQNKAESNTIQDDTVIDVIINCLSSVTGMDALSMSTEMNINELGMSSVTLTELATLIEQELSISIAPSAFFSHNTINKLVDYVGQKMPTQKPKKTTKVVEQTEDDDFAIVGLSALLPGGENADAFWQFLKSNQSAIKTVARWGDEAYQAGTLDNIQQFDNQFFNISNKEAMLMDPQHRLFLQASYQALIDAGYPPSMVNEVGVFAGVQFNDYQNIMRKEGVAQHPYLATGNSHAMLANRVSYLFDFNGPSQTIDTACSSTLVAINRGILALKNRECDLSLCGAVSLLIDKEVTDAANSMGVLSPNYRCATFDQQADGYVRGEGVGVFIIKRLSDAIRDKDAIHAVIKSISEKHGGRANSLTAPNPLIQKELLMKAYDEVLASQVGYIEAHGTGTKLGDPIEIDALSQAFNAMIPEGGNNPIMLGSVKTNVGHLEPAAGVASMIKVIYALKNKYLPANLNFNQLNQFINLTSNQFKIVTHNQPWVSNEPRVAGISSFGFGGSYAHLVLQEAPKSQLSHGDIRALPFILSAKNGTSLNNMKKALKAYLMNHPDISLSSLSYTLCCHRDMFQHRFACEASNINNLMGQLSLDPVDVNSISDDLKQFMQGESVDWKRYFDDDMQKLHAPGYVFNEKNHWFSDVLKAVEGGVQ